MCIIKHHSIINGGIAPRILNLGNRRKRVSGHTPSGKTPGTHWTRGWVDTRAGVEAVENEILVTGIEVFTAVFMKSFLF
jgi:hypothetical protein